RDCRPEIIAAEPPRRFCAHRHLPGVSVLRRRRVAAQARASPDRRRRGAVRCPDLGAPRPVYALAGAEISKILPARLRAAVLQRRPVVRREDREVARAADDIGATGDERTDAGAVGGSGGEHEVICLLSPPTLVHAQTFRVKRSGYALI